MNLSSQNKNENKYYLHSLVEQNRDASTIQAVEYWVNFLFESNDSLRATYWDTNDKNKLRSDYCLFEKLFYQMPKEMQLKYFPPYILSAEKFGNDYLIKTVFAQKEISLSDTTSLNQNPVAIIDVIVLNKNGRFQLKNTLDFESIAYKKFSIGNINYFVHPLITIDTIACMNANQFCDSLSLVWHGHKLKEPINYYVTSGSESLGRLLGFDFAYFGMTYGYTLIDAKYLFSGTKDFNYKHELAHLITGNIKNKLLSEGIATYYGGSYNESYSSLTKEFYKENYPLNDEKIYAILKHINNKKFYIFGALIVSEILELNGISELKKMINIENDDKALFEYIYKLTKTNIEDFIKRINKRLLNSTH